MSVKTQLLSRHLSARSTKLEARADPLSGELAAAQMPQKWPSSDDSSLDGLNEILQVKHSLTRQLLRFFVRLDGRR
jgi:hypothetical protein